MLKKPLVLIAILALSISVIAIIWIKSAWQGSAETNQSLSVYFSQDYGFSLAYPAELDLGQFYDNPDGDLIVFQSRQKEKEKTGFQIFITPYSGSVISREIILRDLSSTIIEDPQEAIIGDGTRALIFWSESPKIGKTREVWFAKNGYLYEITTYAPLDSWLANILSSWRWH